MEGFFLSVTGYGSSGVCLQALSQPTGILHLPILSLGNQDDGSKVIRSIPPECCVSSSQPTQRGSEESKEGEREEVDPEEDMVGIATIWLHHLDVHELASNDDMDDDTM
ncbi:unnamed protein product [Ilex paraguariensis]|uniref:Uncharacterized protein n=1 Tax=Ilex paraguariensis TaxID=185542 RepID=A0ABC8UC12_9AQUA